MANKKNEIAKAKKELKKAMDEGIPKMSRANLLLIFLLGMLKDTIAEFEKYKDSGSSVIKKYERKLESFEGLIDKKYWDEFSLFYIIMALSCRQADNLHEAITMLDNFNKNK